MIDMLQLPRQKNCKVGNAFKAYISMTAYAKFVIIDELMKYDLRLVIAYIVVFAI